MSLAADMGHNSGRATPSLHDAPYRQFEEATGRRSTYPLPIPVQTNPTTSLAHNGRLSAPGGAAGIAQPMLFDPNNRPLWNDPRFADYLRRAGFIAYWRSAKVLPDTCMESNRLSVQRFDTFGQRMHKIGQ